MARRVWACAETIDELEELLEVRVVRLVGFIARALRDALDGVARGAPSDAYRLFVEIGAGRRVQVTQELAHFAPHPRDGGPVCCGPSLGKNRLVLPLQEPDGRIRLLRWIDAQVLEAEVLDVRSREETPVVARTRGSLGRSAPSLSSCARSTSASSVTRHSTGRRCRRRPTIQRSQSPSSPSSVASATIPVLEVAQLCAGPPRIGGCDEVDGIAGEAPHGEQGRAARQRP